MAKLRHGVRDDSGLEITVAELLETLQDISDDDQLIVAVAHRMLNRRPYAGSRPRPARRRPLPGAARAAAQRLAIPRSTGQPLAWSATPVRAAQAPSSGSRPTDA